MVVHQRYLSREAALLQVRQTLPAEARQAAMWVAVVGARLEPENRSATLEVLAALGLDDTESGSR